jgi:hypothetical protein
MRRIPRTRWLRLRMAFALGVPGLLIYELAVRQNWLLVLTQVLLILGIIVTSALDLRDLRRQRS